MTDVKNTPEPRDEQPSRGASRAKDGETIAALAELKAIVLAGRAELAELRERFDELTAVVTAALPAALVALSEESIVKLMKDAPATRLRLLAPYKSSMVDLKLGDTILASDARLPGHYRRMSLGLAPMRDDGAAAAEVGKIIQRRADDIAASGRRAATTKLQEEAERSRKRAADLEAEAAKV